jgi:hypothetical protein
MNEFFFSELNSDHFATLIIKGMIEHDPLKRISAEIVKNELKTSLLMDALFLNATEGKISRNLIKGKIFLHLKEL